MNQLINQRQNLGNMTLDQLADWTASIGVGSQNDQVAKAEFLRRQTVAAERSATATIDNARYMLYSVIAIALTSGLTVIVSVLAWRFPIK